MLRTCWPRHVRIRNWQVCAVSARQRSRPLELPDLRRAVDATCSTRLQSVAAGRMVGRRGLGALGRRDGGARQLGGSDAQILSSCAGYLPDLRLWPATGRDHRGQRQDSDYPSVAGMRALAERSRDPRKPDPGRLERHRAAPHLPARPADFTGGQERGFTPVIRGCSAARS